MKEDQAPPTIPFKPPRVAVKVPPTATPKVPPKAVPWKI